jgi:hypothetical protein
MPKRSRNKSEDANQIAFRVVQESIRDHDEPAPAPKKKRKNPAAVALGRKGGLKGGHARAASMTKAERSESARNAADARWANRPRQP